jgi:hypothetical protein
MLNGHSWIDCTAKKDCGFSGKKKNMFIIEKTNKKKRKINLCIIMCDKDI